MSRGTHQACAEEMARLTRERDELLALVEWIRQTASDVVVDRDHMGRLARVHLNCAEMIDVRLPELRQLSLDNGGRR